MKILLHSNVFWPSIGGTEVSSHYLAKGLVEEGHWVTVVTNTPSSEERDTPYQVVRSPSPATLKDLISSHDIVHSNGASLRCFWQSRLCKVPFSWTHQAYHVSCIDGLGWFQGQPAPIDPLGSILHHLKVRHPIGVVVKSSKLLVRRWVAHQVSVNVAITAHMANRQPLPRQRVIYNPVDPENFQITGIEEAERNLRAADSTFAFLGRLVSEKGVNDLIHAFAMVCRISKQQAQASLPRLKIIGDGPERANLQDLSVKLGVSSQITWIGQKSGYELASEIRRAGICVLPSSWEEPMGIVAVELMYAGKPLIVSEHGGLSECAGEAAITFPNRDREALCRTMLDLSRDRLRQSELILAGLKRAKKFNCKDSIDAYIDMFTTIKAQNL